MRILFAIIVLSLLWQHITSISNLLTLQHNNFLSSPSNTPILAEITSLVAKLENNTVTPADAIRRFEEMSNAEDSMEGSDPLGIASYNLAILHKTSKFKHMDWMKYREYTIKAAMRGSYYAAMELGYMLENSWINDMNLMNQHIDASLKIDESVTFHPNTDRHAMAMVYYTSAALNGHPLAQMLLGYRYLYGINVKMMCPSSAEWYRKAASSALESLRNTHIVLQAQEEKIRLLDDNAFQKRKQSEDLMNFFKYSADKGSGNSQLVYGYAKMYGTRDIAQNGEEARELFLNAFEHGEKSAYASLGKMYAFGIGVEQNNATALEYYTKGMELGDAASINGMGVLHLRGQGVPQDVERAFYYFNQSATEGIPEAQYNLALMYLSGDGVPRSHKKAYHYMTLAAQQALPLAQYYLGLMHLNGWGTPKSCSTAVRFFRHVAERGHIAKLLDVAFDKYYNKHHDEALLLYHQIAATGDEVSQENAAFLFDKLIGTESLFKKAIASSGSEVLESADYYARSRALSLYKEAAQQGIVEAHVKVGDYFYYGRGTPVDYSQSVHHYRKASQKSNARATFNLGYMHENGLGLSQDYFLAKRYYDMAVSFDEKAKVPVYLALVKLYTRWGYQLLRTRTLGGVLFNKFGTGETDSTTQPGTREGSHKNNSADEARSRRVLSLLNMLQDPQKIYKLVRESENISLAVLIVIFVLLSLVRRMLYERQVRAANMQERIQGGDIAG